MVGFCFQLSELDILCVYNGEKSSDWKHVHFNVFIYVFIMFFIKVKNMFFMFFYLQINVSSIYGPNVVTT